MIKNLYLFWISFIIQIVITYAIVCVRDCRKKVPLNYICLFIFTFFEAILVSYCTLAYSKRVIFEAMFLAALISISLMVYAYKTKKDFTMMGGALFIFLFAFIGFSFLMYFVPRGGIMEKIYAVFGIILFGFYLIYDM